MSTPRILKNFNLFVNGRGSAGMIEEMELPEIELNLEETRMGGMDAPEQVDMGQKPMTSKFTFKDPDPAVLATVGLASSTATRLIARASYVRDSDGTRVVAVAELGGRVSKGGLGKLKAGDAGGQEYEMAVNYYKLTVGGVEVYEIDVINMVRRIGGVDQLAGIRADIGA